VTIGGVSRRHLMEISMTKHVVAALLVASTSTLTWTPKVSAQLRLAVIACRHDCTEMASDKGRREQALALARAINAAEGQIADRTRNYVPLAQLGNLPPTPNGFELRLYFDGNNYAFSIKDRLDMCSYGVFSDQDGLLYEKTPQDAKMASQGTRD
jgi:hypothetical protein